jgi:DNA-binding NtrC family response regulator
VPVLSAMQCLEYLRDGVADIVVTDLQMPEMSGIDLCRELSVRHPDVLVIMLTAVVGLEHLVSATRAGAYDFIVKPVKTDLLEIALQRTLLHLAQRREARSTPVDP